jgi:hypothetical protein
MKTPVTNYESRIADFLWRFTLRCLRAAIWRADEWVHVQEVKLREPAPAACVAEKLAPPPEVDRQASAARERTIVKMRKTRRRGMTAAEFDARFAGVRQ